MKDTKYIVYKDRNTDIEEMIIFGQTLQHYDVANQLHVLDWVCGAGFISIGTNRQGFTEVEAYGDSFSLNIKSREEDTMIAKRVFGML